MLEPLDKISSHNIFNYLLPGVLFAVIASKLTHYSFFKLTHYSFLGYEVVVAAFMCYFIGLVVSRIGSLVVEPALKYIKFIKFDEADYKAVVVASKKDAKIELLSEVKNMHRTLCSLFLLLLIKLYEHFEAYWPVLGRFHFIILVPLLFIFALAYRKQTEYLKKRAGVTNES